MCKPLNEASRETSRHHKDVVKTVRASPPAKRRILEWWNHFTSPVIIRKVLEAVTTGSWAPVNYVERVKEAAVFHGLGRKI